MVQPAGESFVLVSGQHHEVGRRSGEVVNDGLFGIGRQRANLSDAEPQICHVGFRAVFRQHAPLRQRRTDARKVFEPLRRDRRIDVHDRQLGAVNQREFQRMGKRNVAVLGKIRGMKDTLDCCGLVGGGHVEPGLLCGSVAASGARPAPDGRGRRSRRCQTGSTA